MKRILAITIILSVCILSFSCSDKEKQTEETLRPVRYVEVGYLGGNKIRTFSGTAQTDKIINLSFRANGIITDFNMRLGQKIKGGELLGKLDNVESRLAYEQSVTQLNSAASQMNTAKLSLNRTRSLYEKGSASLSDFETAKNSYKTAQESYQSAKRGVSIQQEKIQYGYLYAPVDGIIASISAEVDENVSPGSVVATLNAGNQMEITLGIPESVINGVEENMAVTVDFSSLADQKFDGSVTEVSPSVDTNTATYPVTITVTNPSEEIKSGMAANVTFNFGEIANTEPLVVVPAMSVGEDSNGNFVFVIDGDQDGAKVKKQAVTLGELTSEGFVITSGLNAGQKIATAGLQTLLDGQSVSYQ